MARRRRDTDDLHSFFDDLPAYRQMFYEELPDSLNALETDPSPAAQVRASVMYNHIIEGMMALTGYYAWHKICVERGILPGMQELVRHIGDDERRHMAWGTFTCRRHVAADDANWAVFETRMNDLIPLALRINDDAFALYAPDIPFGLSRTSSISTPPTRGCGGSERSVARGDARSRRSTSTTRRYSSRTCSPTRTKKPWPPWHNTGIRTAPRRLGWPLSCVAAARSCCATGSCRYRRPE